MDFLADTQLFTIATRGYAPFAANLHASLDRLGLGSALAAYAADDRLVDDLAALAIDARPLPNAQNLPNWSNHMAAGFAEITACKYVVARNIMAEGRSAAFVDGDIVFLRDPRAHLE